MGARSVAAASSHGAEEEIVATGTRTPYSAGVSPKSPLSVVHHPH